MNQSTSQKPTTRVGGPLAPSLKVSEVFDSVQGEGPSAGEPCTFVRLAGCNLACDFCDTRYSWDWRRYDYASHVIVEPVSRLLVRLRGATRVVITGGEPLLQQKRLATLLQHLEPTVAVEVETNGTVLPDLALRTRVDQWNVSPKLANSGESATRRDVRGALEALRDTGRAWLKFVVQGPEDGAEAIAWATALAWPKDKIQLMPLAADREQLRRSLPVVAGLCDDYGVRLSPRLHIERWNGRRGV